MLKFKDLSPAVQARVRGGGSTKVNTFLRSGRRAGGLKAERVGTELEKAILGGAILSPVLVLEGLPKCGAMFVGGGKAHALPICCDFVGAVVGMGRGVYFDAKHLGVKETGLRCGHEKLVKQHQQKFLRRMAEAGAITGVLVACERRREFLWLDGRHLLGKVAGTIKWDDPRWHVIGPMGVRMDFGKLIDLYVKGKQ